MFDEIKAEITFDCLTDEVSFEIFLWKIEEITFPQIRVVYGTLRIFLTESDDKKRTIFL